MKGEAEIRAAIVTAEDVTAAEDGAPDGKGGSRDLVLAKKLHNDAGNGARFRARYGRDLMCVPAIGRYHWTGGHGAGHWSLRDGDQNWGLLAQKTAEALMWRELAALEQSGAEAARVFELRQWAVQSGNKARLDAMQSVSEPYLARRVDQLDADPYLFNVQNGTLELVPKGAKGGVRLRRAARTDLITRIAAVGYDRDAECVQFRRFLDRVVPDKDVQAWLQKWCGYALTGNASEHVLVMLLGEGRNGKGTLVRLLAWLWGDYSVSISFASLAADDRRRGGEASPDLARLPGVRLAFAAEPRKGVRLDDGRIKELTGEDRQVARKLNRDPFEFDPVFKLAIQANNRPRIADTSTGMWARVRLVPFNVTIPEGERDHELLDKLKREGPGILNWCLDGFLAWRDTGLAPPAPIAAATAEYRRDSDDLGLFLEAATVAGDGVRSAELYACYEGWAIAMDQRAINKTRFGRDLTTRGYAGEQRGSNRVVWRCGLAFSPAAQAREWPWGEPI